VLELLFEENRLSVCEREREREKDKRVEGWKRLSIGMSGLTSNGADGPGSQ